MLRAKSFFIMLVFTDGILDSNLLGATDTENRPSMKVGVHFVCDTSFHASRMKEPAPNSSILTYLNIMLHAAEVYFRELECPKIELYLVGLYNTTEEEEKTFEVTNKILKTTFMDGPFTLALFQEWVNKSGQFNESDIVILLTSYLLYDYFWSTKQARIDGGISYQDGICTHLRVGLVEDKGRYFDGLSSLVDQIAHLLGTPWNEGHEAPDCLGKDGYLVSLDTSQKPLPMLSNCTKDYLLQKYQNNFRTRPCWIDTPKTFIERTQELPVDYFKQEDFCKANRPNYPNDTTCPVGHQEWDSAPVCKLPCCKNDTSYRRPYRPSPDGTNCTSGDGEKVCLSDICVTL
uniref:Putative salivary gland metalloprotease n=1 Tax=Ixodes ricinus TaxID=34613 RepID=A0A6B0VAN2_IXORI